MLFCLSRSADAGATNVANGGTPQPRPQNKRLQQTQAQVDEVVDIMRVNMEKVLERDAKLSQLDDRADALQAGASQFEASAGKLKNKYWWKNMKVCMFSYLKTLIGFNFLYGFC
ncbi:unnamed protein product [Schistosoma mattheei]|uniref:Uncharacterized protein n=1 Tax=Schistosoma mattheei TaxID=31246 RepID=A0A183PXZ8_9TREM|nr:unnamed protein product [Schistosoma mattheei]